MPDTQRDLATLQALLADNTTAQVSPQDLRDALVSALGGYGSIYAAPTAPISQALTSTPTKYIGFDTNGPASGCIVDYLNDIITVQNAGDYLVSFCVSMGDSTPPSQTATFRLRKNSLPVSGLLASAKFNSQGDRMSMCFTGIVTCAANDFLAVWAESDSPMTIVVAGANLTVKRLS